MPVSAAIRARLVAAHAAGGVPSRRGNGLAMFVGLPRMMVQDTAGHLTEAGREWIALGGAEPVAFPHPLEGSDKVKYVTEGGHRRILQRWDPTAQEWQNTKAGHLRFRSQNEWSVLVPVIGHEETRRTARCAPWRTSSSSPTTRS